MYATETILDCLSEKDVAGIKEQLSLQTSSLSDIDKQIQAMIDTFDGKITSYNEDLKSISYNSGIKKEGIWVELEAEGSIPEIVTNTWKKYKELIVVYQYASESGPDLIGVKSIVLTETDGTNHYVNDLVEAYLKKYYNLD